jgi:hypothetical protein
MPAIETFADHQRRLLAHIYASLRDCIADEVEDDRTPDFEPLEDEDCEAMEQLIYKEVTALMVAAHPEEAATIEAEIAAYWANARWSVDAHGSN